jgi:hypothetical protein
LFVSKYNKEEKFNRKTQWKKKEPVKVYVKLVAKNDNSKILFDILEELKFDKNIKANNILVEHCVAQLKDEIEDVKTKSRVLYTALQRTDRNRQKKYISIMLCFVAVAFFFLILSGIYELK